MRAKQYLDIDVLTAARQRVQHVLETFDSVAVMFSGGKDSLVCLRLLLESRLVTLPLRVVFRDEELIPMDVVDYVASFRDDPRIDLKWYAVPLRAERVVLGSRFDYIQWDPERVAAGNTAREMPPWAIRSIPGHPEGTVFDQYTLDTEVAKDLKGKVALVTGVRASESINRYRACVNKLNENYITGSGRALMVKPIFDWEENDVLKYLHETGGWCNVYDKQHLSGAKLRVSTPTHAEAVKFEFGQKLLRKRDPELYRGVTKVFPTMAINERYAKDFNYNRIIEEVSSGGFDAIEAWIEGNFTGSQLESARKVATMFRTLSEKDPTAYPPRWLMHNLVKGRIKSMIQPLDKAGQKKYAELSKKAKR